jgi:hypothetical protein
VCKASPAGGAVFHSVKGPLEPAPRQSVPSAPGTAIERRFPAGIRQPTRRTSLACTPPPAPEQTMPTLSQDHSRETHLEPQVSAGSRRSFPPVACTQHACNSKPLAGSTTGGTGVGSLLGAAGPKLQPVMRDAPARGDQPHVARPTSRRMGLGHVPETPTWRWCCTPPWDTDRSAWPVRLGRHNSEHGRPTTARIDDDPPRRTVEHPKFWRHSHLLPRVQRATFLTFRVGDGIREANCRKPSAPTHRRLQCRRV